MEVRVYTYALNCICTMLVSAVMFFGSGAKKKWSSHSLLRSLLPQYLRMNVWLNWEKSTTRVVLWSDVTRAYLLGHAHASKKVYCSRRCTYVSSGSDDVGKCVCWDESRRAVCCVSDGHYNYHLLLHHHYYHYYYYSSHIRATTTATTTITTIGV